MDVCLHLAWDPKSRRRNADAVHTEGFMCVPFICGEMERLPFQGLVTAIVLAWDKTLKFLS